MHGQISSRDYWASYYAKGEAPLLPSQFAAFVANEMVNGDLPRTGTVIEAGCGNGRDSFFFLQLGHAVRAIDASEVAIASCNERLARQPDALRTRGSFMAGPADHPNSWDALAGDTSGPLLIYTRFFFHAIKEDAQNRVLDAATGLLRARGGALCVEARSHRDADSAKATPLHYRRFIDPDDFARAVADRDMRLVYRAEGYGMAKYRQDDAHVFRIIAVA